MPALSPELAAQIPSHLHDIALRLIAGSDQYYAEMLDRHERILRRLQDVAESGPDAPQSAEYIMLSRQIAYRGAEREVAASMRLDREEYLDDHFQIADLRQGQRPDIGVITCIDSRVEIHKLLGLRIGKGLIARNAGGVLLKTGQRAHRQPDSPLGMRISIEGMKALRFYKIKEIKTVILATHGLCGAVEASHAHCCAHHPRELDDIVQDRQLTCDEMGDQLLGESMRYVFDLVQEKGAAFYLDKMRPLPKDMTESDRNYLAMEIALALYNRELVDSFFKNTPTRIVTVHMDLRSFNPYLYNDVTGQFVALTNHPPISTAKRHEPSAHSAEERNLPGLDGAV